MSSNKAPSSLIAMESQLKKNEKLVQNLEMQYEKIVEQIGQKNLDLEWAKNTGDISQIPTIKVEQQKLDIQSMDVATKLEIAKEESIRLKKELEQLKLNPQSSMEVQNLKAKIDLAVQSLEKSKEEANDLAKNIEQCAKSNFKRFGINTDTISEGFEKVSSKLDKFKNKMSRLISTAMVFSFLRRGLTSLSNGFISLLKSNDTFSNSMNQIKANLMTAFTPIYNSILPALNSLMKALSKVTGTIAIFINSLFGNTASQAKKNAQALYGQAKATEAVNEAQEGLASFDKLEVNNENSNTGGTGGSSSDTSLNFDNELTYSQKLLNLLNAIRDFISENKEGILALIGGIVGGILAMKLGLEGIQALGIGVMIFGIITLIESIISYLNDSSWENFGNIISSIGVIILGLGITIGSVPLMIAGAIALIIGLVVSNWEKIKGLLQNAINWLFNNLDYIKEKFGIVGVFIATIFANALEWIIYTFEDIFGGLKRILDGIIDLVAGVFTGDWERAWNGIKNIVGEILQTLFGVVKAPLNGIIALLNGIIEGVNYLISGLNSISLDVPDWVPFMGGKKFGFNIPKIGKIPMLASGAVIPPNKKFTAVLGDQTHGKNLEAPESLIRKIVREESGEKEVILNATFIMQCETEEIGRASLRGIKLLENIDGQEYLLN